MGNNVNRKMKHFESKGGDEGFCVFFSQNDRLEKEGTVYDFNSIRTYSTLNIHIFSITIDCEDPNVDSRSESMNNVFDLPF